ncbi:class I mannose-6-phosphate isomerase [Sphingomonas sp. VDB2]|uniref:class I mannose-6-phosphate isomerase n=1 Tax=Sphingomonas sp. VDB2 TaxID=3228751 RepID=UPI003A7F6C67
MHIVRASKPAYSSQAIDICWIPIRMTATKLKAHYVEKIWGRSDIANLPASLDGRHIGEIWYEGAAAAPLPLLIKTIYTREKLSIQVHPDDAYGRSHGVAGGKEECWYILDVEPGATLGIGTIVPMDAEALRHSALNGELEQMMDWKPVAPGDFYFIPAGTVHAIGAGISLVEVQQNVDITYRLYDYGRPRELHLDDGVAVSKAAPYLREPVRHPIGETAALLDEGPFKVHLRHMAARDTLDLDGPQYWVMALRGKGHFGEFPWEEGDCWLVEGGASITADIASDILIAHC